jgi:hypothetical protein
MNVAEPDLAFQTSFIPNDGIGLARLEFIINNYLKIHPLALLNFAKQTPAVKAQIAKMPMDWQILVGEPDIGDLEVLPLTSINDRGFRVFQFNPLSSYRPSFPDIEILDVYHEVNWYAPKLKNGQMLAVPLNDEPEPDCVYFVKDVSRNCEIVDYNKAW